MLLAIYDWQHLCIFFTYINVYKYSLISCLFAIPTWIKKPNKNTYCVYNHSFGIISIIQGVFSHVQGVILNTILSRMSRVLFFDSELYLRFRIRIVQSFSTKYYNNIFLYEYMWFWVTHHFMGICLYFQFQVKCKINDHIYR